MVPKLPSCGRIVSFLASLELETCFYSLVAKAYRRATMEDEFSAIRRVFQYEESSSYDEYYAHGAIDGGQTPFDFSLLFFRDHIDSIALEEYLANNPGKPRVSELPELIVRREILFKLMLSPLAAKEVAW